MKTRMVWLGIGATALLLWGCPGEEENYDWDNDGVVDDQDCAPQDSSVFPGATEHCSDETDNDCDGYIDLEDPECGECEGAGISVRYDCGDLTLEGCCDGETLYWCENNYICTLECYEVAPYCGWHTGGQYIYDCNTPGDPAPDNDPPMECPPGIP